MATIEMANSVVINSPIMKWGADIVTKKMTVTASESTEAKAGYPLTLGADGVSASLGNAGGSGKVLGILAEDATVTSSGVLVSVIYAGTVYAEGIKAALSTADTDKLSVTPGKIVVIAREEHVIYG